MIKIAKKLNRVYVLDTNVLIHDPAALFKFEEHTVFIPTVVLEELDKHKRGQTDIARNARQTHRLLANMLTDVTLEQLGQGIEIKSRVEGRKSGKLLFQTFRCDCDAKPDNAIIAVAKQLAQEVFNDQDTTVVLVTKDINLRIKSIVEGILSEDYLASETATLVGEGELLFSGEIEITEAMWNAEGVQVEVDSDGTQVTYRIAAPWVTAWPIGAHVYSDSEPKPFAGILRACDNGTLTVELLPDFNTGHRKVWGINARNRQQNYALSVLMDPEIDFVSIAGDAGTGKTLITLAAGLQQVFDDKTYAEIIITRATVPLGEDIGFLPGAEEEKLLPWMGAVRDALEFLSSNLAAPQESGDWGRQSTLDFISQKVKLRSSAFMRGRSFQTKYFIIDEAQNLTPPQMKSLISRAGPGTKVIAIGNLKQIDTPYLSPASSGFSFVIERMRNWRHSAHITLDQVVRSRLADYVATALAD